MKQYCLAKIQYIRTLGMQIPKMNMQIPIILLKWFFYECTGQYSEEFGIIFSKAIQIKHAHTEGNFFHRNVCILFWKDQFMSFM